MTTQTLVPLHFVATPAARDAFGDRLPAVAREAFLQVGRRGEGFAIHHHAFRVLGRTVAVASRMKASGVVEIDLDVIEARLPARSFTRANARAAHERLKRGAERGHRGPDAH